MEDKVCTARDAASALYALAVDSGRFRDDDVPSNRGIVHLTITLFDTIKSIHEEWEDMFEETNHVPCDGAGQPVPVTHRRRLSELEGVSIEITGMAEALPSMTFDLEEHDGRRKGFTCIAQHLSAAARNLGECMEGLVEGAS